MLGLVVIVVGTVIALVIAFAVIYNDGRKARRDFGLLWDTPTQVGGNPAFRVLDYFYAKGWYSIKEKE